MKKLTLFLILTTLFSILKCTAFCQTKPNIVFILADDLGYGDVSANNPDSKIKTPNIDNIANNGMRFTAAHSSSSVCTPSRYSIITGRYNWRTQLKSGALEGYGMPLIDSSRVTIADILKKKNYNTACIGKWHIGLQYSTTDGKPAVFNAVTGENNISWKLPLLQTPNDLGFDEFFGIAASADIPPYMYIKNRNFVGSFDVIKGDKKFMNVDQTKFFRPGPASNDVEPGSILPRITTAATEYIKSQSAEKPFFLYFSLTAPHTPVVPSAQFKGKSGLNDYLDYCLEVDYTIGEVVKSLKEKGLYENTLIIITSDNGFAPYVDVNFLENHGHYPSYIFRGYKGDAWEGGHRIPLLAQWPGKIKPHSITNEVVSLTDWFATVANITNTSFPDNAGEDSYSLLPLLLGKQFKAPLREATVSHSIRGEFCIQKGMWKLVLCNEKTAGSVWGPDRRFDISQSKTPFMLYNLEVDPEEMHNLYETNPAKVVELKKLLTKYIEDGRSTKGKPQQNDPVEKWSQIDWMTNVKN